MVITEYQTGGAVIRVHDENCVDAVDGRLSIVSGIVSAAYQRRGGQSFPRFSTDVEKHGKSSGNFQE